MTATFDYGGLYSVIASHYRQAVHSELEVVSNMVLAASMAHVATGTWWKAGYVAKEERPKCNSTVIVYVASGSSTT